VPDPGELSLSLEEVFQDLLVPIGKPVLAGFPTGHCSPSATFPLGVAALLDADAGTVAWEEPALG
jgi:muramoyltetrapeptide carboxypeptidase